MTDRLPLPATIRGAFLGRAPLATREVCAAELTRLQTLGVNTVFAETLTPPGWLPALCADAGLPLIIGIPCFFDRDDGDGQRWLAPRYADQRVPEPVEWYRGISPADEARVSFLRDQVRHLASLPVSGVLLDFIRWPVHWEIEFRGGAVPPIAGYDESAQRARGTRPVPTAMRERITDVVRTLTHDIRAAGAPWVGVCVVPVQNEQQADVVGQDLEALGCIVNALLPMAYHAIMLEDPDWTRRISEQIAATAGVPVMPIFQTTSAPEYAGSADWGVMGASEQKRVIAALGSGSNPLVAFPGVALRHAIAPDQ